MVVIFVDVLGTKNTVDFDQKYEVHRIFHEEIATHTKRQADIPYVVYDRKVFSFSDCAYFFFYYKDGIEEVRKDDLNLAHIASHNVSMTMLKLLSKGYLTRGGVTIGDAYIDDLGFFGPAVERAYYIESKEVTFPRLQFERTLGEQIYEWERDHEPDPIKEQLYKENSYMVDSEANAYFVNIFQMLQITGQILIGKEILTLESVKRTVLTKIEADLIQFADDPAVTIKLNWLKQYVSSKQQLIRPEYVDVAVTNWRT